MYRIIMLSALAALLSACARPEMAGCNDISCRPVSDPHSLSVWWQPDLRNGAWDYTRLSVNE
ncbi:HrpT family type III secretion system protein [Acerihabitans arboris]|uniref:Type III secretion protein HrpT n=1 Tax=Acerihabitans arboris TaxID=2691583 RepID=A0A845SJE2_9GAMM|nr:HrpT family type III secretion system protein [Acerihabitans arboris]NDL63377.1 type III secretion protein HrpT [Acerihabitans arboris]